MLLDKIQNIENLTPQEKHLVEYLVAHPKDILTMNITELAQVSYTSSATVFRLCKKAGVSGYSEFKMIYASELPNILELAGDLDVQNLQIEDDMLMILKKLRRFTNAQLVIQKSYRIRSTEKYSLFSQKCSAY